MASRTRRLLPGLVGVVMASLVAVAAVSAQASPGTGKGFIWKVERDGRTGWLVGSIHVLTEDHYPLPDGMNKAFLRAVTLMEEVDLDQLSSPEMMGALASKAMYVDGQTLETQLSKDTYRLVVDRLTTAGLPVEAILRMKPWMITLTLVALNAKRGGFDSQLGVDKHYRDMARRMGKKFRPLETPIEQIEFLDKLSPDVQDSMLRETIEQSDAGLTQLKTTANAWRAGDVATVEGVVLGALKSSPPAYQSLIVDRNRNWLPKIEACLETGHCFVVVGAGHVVGPDGLITMLKRKGYSVEQE